MALPLSYVLAKSPDERSYLLRMAERDDALRHAEGYRVRLDRAVKRHDPRATIDSLTRQVVAYETQAAQAELVMDAISARWMMEAA